MKPTNVSGGGDLSDCKISFQLVNLVFDGEVRVALEAFHLALHSPLNTVLGRLEG